MAINIIVQYTSGFLPYILLFTQAPILVWFDGTIIDIISTILLTGPHAFGPKYVYIGHKILMKQPHDCSY